MTGYNTPRNADKSLIERLDVDFVLKAAQLGIWEIDPFTNLVEWDNYCGELFGLKESQLPYQQVITHIHPDDISKVDEMVKQALISQSANNYDITFRTIGADNGLLRWVRLSGRSYVNESGELYRFSGIAHEVTQLNRVEENRRQTAELLQSVFDSSTEGISVLKSVRDQRGEIIDFEYQRVNHVTKQTNNRTDLVGKLYSVVHSDFKRVGLFDNLKEVVNTGQTRHLEFLYQAEGLNNWYNTTAIKLNDGVLLSFRDITQEINDKQRLEASKTRFRSLVEEAPVATCLFVGRHMIIEAANEVMLRYWGKDKSVIGKPHEEAMPELKNQAFGQILDNVFITGEAYEAKSARAELEVNGLLGTYYFDFTYKPLANSAGEIDAILAMVVDVTEQVIARQKLEESNIQLEFAIEAAELGTWDLNPKTNKFTANTRLKDWFGILPDKEIDLSVATNVIAEKDRTRVVNAIQYALEYSSGGRYDIYYTIINPITKKERIVRAKGKARFTEEKIVYQFNGTLQDITEQKKAEEETRKLLAIMEASHEFIGLAAPDTSIQYGNPAALRMLGWNNVEGKKILDYVYPEDWKLAEDFLSQTLEKGHSSHEIRFINALTREPFWMQWNGVTVKENASDEIIGLATVSTNIMERKKAEESLKESETRFRSLIEEAPFAIAVYISRDFIIETANDAMINVWGKTPSVIKMKLADALPELEGQPFIGLLEQVYDTGKEYQTNEQQVNLVTNGRLQTYWFTFTYQPLTTDKGQVYAILNMAVDVTERVLARKKIEEAEATLRGAIELAELATWSLDVEQGVFSYSDRFMKWLGFSEETKSLDEAFNPLPDEYRQPVADAITAALQPGSSGFYENEHPIINRITGQVRMIHAQAQVLYNASGKAICLKGTAQDITRQRQLQSTLEQLVQERTEELEATNEELAAINEEYAATNEELTESNQLLIRSNDNLQQFAYIASHDLQEPLRKVQQFGDLLKSQYADKLGEGISYLERMQTAASRMSTLIRDLLSFSRIATQQDTTTLVSLNEVIKNVLTDLDLRIQETGAVVNVSSLPKIQGDRSQLGQLFQNLLSNALKFRLKDKSPLIQISARRLSITELPPSLRPTRIAAAYHCIDISDNGIGFDQKYVDRIFQVFQRLHGKSEFAGTGIGLAICEKVAANHGGAITATSTLGNGATFHLYLPTAANKV